MTLDIEVIKNIEIFSNGMLFAVVAIMAFFFLVHSSRHPLYWRVFGLLMALMSFLSLVDSSILFCGKYSDPYFRQINYLCILMIVPVFRVWIHCLVYQSVARYKLRKLVFFEMLPLFFCFALGCFGFEWSLGIALLYVIPYAITFAAIYVRDVVRFNRLLAETYSDTEYRDLKWIRNTAILCGVLFLSFLMFALTNSPLLSAMHSLVTSLILVFIGYNIYHQRPVNMRLLAKIDLAVRSDRVEVAEDESADVHEEGRLRLSEEITEQIRSNLAYAMKEDKLYLDSDLTINELAVKVGTNSAYMSHYINKIVGMSFVAYINGLRLKYVERLLVERKDMSVEEVAKASGFNSLNTMQRAFSAHYKCTPNQYRQVGGKLEKLQDDENAAISENLPALGILSKEDANARFNDYCEQQFPGYEKILLEYETSLTHREILLAMLVALGYDNERIAVAMELSAASLNVTRSRLRSKMKLQRTDMLKMVICDILESGNKENN